MPKLYALLVGINAYSGGMKPLKGCLHDIETFRAYLEDAYDPADLAIEELRDAEATRENVVEVFGKHLGQAQSDDIALFHYCGHGARWRSAPEFKPFFPDGQDEGLVCVDSNPFKDRWDVADKDLAVMIDSVARQGAHVAMIFDCCHSGSATRSAAELLGDTMRQADDARDDVPEERTPRPLETYADGYYARFSKDDVVIPQGRHVLLAACDRTQSAYETELESGVKGGAFTAALIHALEQSKGDVSYADLFVRTRAAIRARGEEQTPQFEAYGGFDARQGFLGREIKRRGSRSSVFLEKNQRDGKRRGTIELGAIHGVPVDRPVELRLFRAGEKGEIGRARTIAVKPQTAVIELDFDAGPEERLEAEPTSFLAPPLPVLFRGSTAQRDDLAEALERSSAAGELVSEPNAARFELRAEDSQLRLVEHVQEIPIRFWSNDDPERWTDIAETLSAIGHWQRSFGLQNPRPRLDAEKIDFWIEPVEEGDKRYSETEGLPERAANDPRTRELAVDTRRHVRRLTRGLRGEEGEKLEFKLRARVRNRTGQKIHVALLHSSSLEQGARTAFRIQTTASEPLENDQEKTLLKKWRANLDPDQRYGVEQLKLLVSTEPLDSFRLAQPEIVLGEEGSTRGGQSFDDDGEDDRIADDWLTKTIELTLVREEGEIGAGDAATAGGGTVKVRPHPTLSGRVALARTRAEVRGGSDSSTLARMLGSFPPDASGRRPFQLITLDGARETRDVVEGTVLELTDLRGTETLAKEPLEIELDVDLEDDEVLLPLCFDGEHILLGGDTEATEEGKVLVTVDHLPDLPDDGRAIGKALKLYFFKTYLKSSNVNRLAWVDDQPNGPVRRTDELARKVADSERILLLTHGITGDTEGQAAGLREIRNEHFDLTLTFDYENLSTPIEETAADLLQKLRDVGLGPDDGKRLVIVAHSMGGLVCRWMIEQLGASDFVDHLVLCGTPNGGSPYGYAREARIALRALVSVALNLSQLQVPYLARAVKLILGRTERVTPTLEQMRPGSDFLEKLNAPDRADPGIPYTVLAGNVELYDEKTDPLFRRLLAKAGRSIALEALFRTTDHDIAVSVESIGAVGGSTAPATRARHVACHHLNYFDSEPGLAALRAVEWSSRRGPLTA